ncbi:RNA polymerase sigma factor [Hyalangium rubrum]|uniref:RNA polymerase sigma factor n=1 Tax=Hyalangium rubrum TaxID=3103134 RepID=A0ABU5H5Y1_9BACT|nr:RNA polymerase sigma factor [Hyalangium sp. s54d21]MDY7228893.1 RNA polymerase sigma factor [Hyalangium sp. s54d21]
MSEFSEFIRCHRPGLLRIARRFCRGGQDAEDLVQETLERALLHFSQVSRLHPNAQRAWLAQTVSRLFIDLCRRQSKEELLSDPVPVAESALHAGAESPERWAQVSPEELQRAVEQLPEFLGAPFRMRLAGQSYKAIAQSLSASEGTVGSWLFQARKQLRETLMSEEPEVRP